MLYSRIIDSPVGQLLLVASSDGLRALLWPGWVERVPVGQVDDGEHDPNGVLDSAATQLGEYFDGIRTDFDLPLDPIGSPFQQLAWDALRTIPYGETVSYGEQARRLGDIRKARAVGAANGKNPISIIVPCHRVVGSNGSLTGFGGGIANKAWLLDHERRVWMEQLSAG